LRRRRKRRRRRLSDNRNTRSDRRDLTNTTLTQFTIDDATLAFIDGRWFAVRQIHVAETDPVAFGAIMALYVRISTRR
jgi:hypothetical protein